MIWNGGGTLTLQVGPSAADGLALTGALTMGTGSTFTLDLLNTGVTTTPGDLDDAGDPLPRRPLPRAISRWSLPDKFHGDIGRDQDQPED